MKKPTGKMLGTQMLPIGDIVSHPSNPNEMTPELLEKLRAMIKRSGRYPHVLVRPHPTLEGKWEILDGHQRTSVLRELDHPQVRCDVWDVNDREAELPLATMNRLEGQDVPLKRAELVHDLLKEFDLESLAGLLPESADQLKELEDLLEFPAGDVAEQLQADEEEDDKKVPAVLHFVVPQDQVEAIEKAVEAASDGEHGRDRKGRGLIKLAEHFMSTYVEPTEVSKVS